MFGVAPQSQEKIVKDDSKPGQGRTFGQTWTIGSGKDQAATCAISVRRAHGGDAFVIIFPALRVMQLPAIRFRPVTLPDHVTGTTAATGAGYSETRSPAAAAVKAHR